MSIGTVPAQTLTFLFTELRDYTAFVERHGDAVAATLIADYRRIVRAAVTRTGGGEIKTEGDSFYVVFSTAHRALQCAMAILREAEQYNAARPERALRIGIGIHAGEPVPQEGQYVGSAVNLAARLAQQAGAGEILVSEIIRGLLRTSAAPPMSERTGLVLKGVAEAPRVFVVSWDATPSRTSAVAPERSKPAAKVSIPAEPSPDLRILSQELIGREKELAALEAALGEVATGKGRTLLIAGDAGLGKSAIIRAFAEHVRASGLRYLLGECTEVEARRPFGPFVQVLRSAFREFSATDVERSLRENAVELLRLLPELSRGQVASQPVDESERYRVHESFATLLADLARAGRLVLAVEDLHWADEATLELFPYLARRLRDQPVLLVATYRSDELHRLHPLNHVLAELARTRLAERLRLRKLSVDETGAVIRAALGLKRAPTTEFREAIHERCEGNPFFVEEVLKALVERGDLVYRDGAWEREKDVVDLAIPESVRDAVQQRLRLLSPEARRAVQVAAVIGQTFDFALLQRVTGLTEPSLLDALRAAVDAQLLTEEADHGGEELYAFRHALTREAVLAEFLQRERRLLHRAVGEAIEARAVVDASAQAEALAYHFDQARDQAPALRYHDLAAAEAMRAFAFARAVRHLERAVELADDDDPSLGGLELRLAEAAFMAQDLTRALRAAEEARRLFAAANDGRWLGEALVRISRYRGVLGEVKGSQEAVDESVRVLEPLGESAELAEACAMMAGRAALDGRFSAAVEWGERALAMARRTAAIGAEVHALATVGPVMVERSRLEEGVRLSREALDVALRHELVAEAQRAYQNLHFAVVAAGASERERAELFERWVAHARRYGFRTSALNRHQSEYAMRDGDWDAALEFAAEIAEVTHYLSGSGQLGASFILTARHGPERGLPLVEVPRRRLLAQGDAQSRANSGLAAAVALVASEPNMALEFAEPVADVLVGGVWTGAVDIAPVCAIAAARMLGDEGALRRWIDLALNPSANVTAREARARRAFAEAERSVLAGDIDAAIDVLAGSADLFGELLWYPGTLARLRRADLLLQRAQEGDREAAAADLVSVVPFWRKAKAVWYLGRLREWAAQRGLPFPER